MKAKVIVCSFTAGVGDMKRKDQKDEVKVLRVLAAAKRFSVFEATENDTIARMMDWLQDRYFVRTGGAFPWVEIELTQAGLDLLAEFDGNAVQPASV